MNNGKSENAWSWGKGLIAFVGLYGSVAILFWVASEHPVIGWPLIALVVTLILKGCPMVCMLAKRAGRIASCECVA
jgi:hypothetical protein